VFGVNELRNPQPAISIVFKIAHYRDEFTGITRSILRKGHDAGWRSDMNGLEGNAVWLEVLGTVCTRFVGRFGNHGYLRVLGIPTAFLLQI
jgi:hypothetical protein